MEAGLDRLLAAINALPDSALADRRTGPLATYLTPALSQDDNNPTPIFPSHAEGPYFIFNRQWERAFQKKPSDPPNHLLSLICRGKNGLILAHTWATHYSALDGKDEVELYFGNLSPVPLNFDDPLRWWKENQGTLKFMALVARDILAIPGVDVSVERLFSSMKHTLTDPRSSKTAETASMDIVCKEWLKSGLAKGVNYTDFIKIRIP